MDALLAADYVPSNVPDESGASTTSPCAPIRWCGLRPWPHPAGWRYGVDAKVVGRVWCGTSSGTSYVDLQKQ